MTLFIPKIDSDSNAEPQSDQQPAVSQTLMREYLMAAALQQVELVLYYIECKGLHPDVTWGGRPTALCYAAMKANQKLLQYLLDKGASVNYRDALGMTPLHYGTLGGNEACITLLINHGASLNAVNYHGKTPLALAWELPRLATCRDLLQRHGASLQNIATTSQWLQ